METGPVNNMADTIIYIGLFFTLIFAFIHVKIQKKTNAIVEEELISNITEIMKKLENNIESNKAFKNEVAVTFHDLSVSISNLEKKIK